MLSTASEACFSNYYHFLHDYLGLAIPLIHAVEVYEETSAAVLVVSITQ